MPYLTKQYKFCAAHRYWNAGWSEQKNKENFDKDIFIHGHNYLLDVTVSGPINPESGFVINLKILNDIIKYKVLDILDHSQIEKDIGWFSDKQPSTENLVIYIWEQISMDIPLPAKLYKIRLQETPTIYTEYYGLDDE